MRREQTNIRCLDGALANYIGIVNFGLAHARRHEEPRIVEQMERESIGECGWGNDPGGDDLEIELGDQVHQAILRAASPECRRPSHFGRLASGRDTNSVFWIVAITSSSSDDQIVTISRPCLGLIFMLRPFHTSSPACSVARCLVEERSRMFEIGQHSCPPQVCKKRAMSRAIVDIVDWIDTFAQEGKFAVSVTYVG
jgi:hypothetical protein